MAKMRIENIICHLDYDMKRALEQAVSSAGIANAIDRNRLFKEFVRAIGRKCSTWENVPDRYVEK